MHHRPSPKIFHPTAETISTAGGVFPELANPIYDVIHIEGFTFNHTGGIFIQAKPGCQIIIRNNQANEIVRAPGQEYAQFVQISGLHGSDLPATPCTIQLEISGNHVTNTRGFADVEDVINLIAVRGTPQSPLSITGNTLEGAYPLVPSAGYSGSLIMLDRGTWYAKVQGNRCTESDNVGIGIAGGCQNQVVGNVVRALKGGNVGIYCSNQYKGDPFQNNTVGPNIVQWFKADGSRNDVWIEGW